MATKLTGHILVLPWIIDPADLDVTWKLLLCSQDGTAAGAIADFRLFGALKAVTAFDGYRMVGETGHEMRPGWWATAQPTYTSGDAATFDSSNIRQWNTSNGVIGWTVPSSGVPTCDRLSLYIVDQGTNFRIRRRRGGSGGVGGTIVNLKENVVGGGSAGVCVTVTPDSGRTILPGDEIEIVSETGGQIAVYGMAIYSSTLAPLPDDGYHRVPADWNFIGVQPKAGHQSEYGTFSSSAEQALACAPAGSTPLFVGGSTHQGGSDNAEVDVVEAWTKDGVSWALARGYTMGAFVLTRTANVQYTGGGAKFATLTNTYNFYGYDWKNVWVLAVTAVGGMDTGNSYGSMLHPLVDNGFDAAFTDLDAGPIVVTNGGNNTLDVATRLIAQGELYTGGVYHFLTYPGTLDACFIQAGGKSYFRTVSNETNVAQGQQRTATANYFIDDPDAKTKPTLSVAVGTNGLTVTVTIDAKSPTTPGTTGTTIKRGGSALTIDSRVNNGDGTVTLTLAAASKVYQGETITFDHSAGNISDTYDVKPADVTAGSVTNNSAQVLSTGSTDGGGIRRSSFGAASIATSHFASSRFSPL